MQTEVATADFSANLRAAVQGARACVDAGAELLVASAQVLDGAFPGGLSERSSFLLQARAALQALADELSAPMLMASYAGEPGDRQTRPRPYLVGCGRVRRLTAQRVFRMSGARILAHVGPQTEIAAPEADLHVFMPTQAWHAQQQREDVTQATQLSVQGRAAVVAARSVAWADGCVLGGGSLAAARGVMRCRLPLFSAGSAVWDTETDAPSAAAHLPDVTRLLWECVCFALTRAVRQGGYRGVAVEEKGARARLLRAAADAALGGRRVHLLRAAAGSVRVRCARLQDAAERRGLLLLSGASREDFLCNAVDTALAGELAPFGDMYESEIAQLEAYAGLGEANDRQPAPEELALRALVDENRSPAEIVCQDGMDENTLRATLRRIARAAALRHTASQPVPLLVHHRAPELPRFHRLME